MKWKIALIFAIVLGGIGGSWLKNLPGFVIIAYQNTSFEMRLWVFIALLVIAVTLVVFSISILRSVMGSAGRMRGWRGERQFRKARIQTIKGLLSFIEGRWNQSENTMINSVKNSDTKLINYLIAAQSAQHQQAEDRRDGYLRLAHKAEPDAMVAIGLTQAQLQLDNAQFEQALATLTELNNKQPHHPFVLKLLSATYLKLEDWRAIIQLLPELKKYKALAQEKLLQLETKSVDGLLKKEFAKGQLETLQDTWLNLPSSSRKLPANVICYARLLIMFEQMKEAERLIKPLIKKQANDELVNLYGQLKDPQSTKLFSFLENWFNQNPQAPLSIYLALGKLAYNEALWGKAKHYLELAIKSAPTAEAYFMMAKTLRELDDSQSPNEFYQRGLEFAINPNLPSDSLVLEKGSDDLVSANLLPKFETNR